MEGSYGALCRTGCVAEVDIDLRCRSDGKIVREGTVASNPEAIAAFVKSHAPHVVRIGLETGATSTWLWTALKKMGLPIFCIDARHAKAALKMQINKSDRNDALASRGSCNAVGTKRFASRGSRVMRCVRFWRAVRYWLT